MPSPLLLIRSLPALLACLLALATSACSDAPEGNDHVDYDGTTLTVEGTDYERERITSASDKVFPGRILISAWPAALPRTLVHIKRYGLTLEGHTENGRLLVKVPEGYEWQWAQAIQVQLGGETTATIDPERFPTPMEAPGPGSGLRSIVQMADEREAKAMEARQAQDTPPTREPVAAEVRQAFVERYAAIEKMGGLTLTLPSNGASTVVHSRLYDVSKATCSPSPQTRQRHWDCSATLKRSICTGDCTPSFSDASEAPERITLTWNATDQRYGIGR